MRAASFYKKSGFTTIGLLCGWWFVQSPKAAAQDPLERLDQSRFGPGTLIRALEELDTYRPPQAVELVLPLLGHVDLDVSRTAAWLLRRMERASLGVQTARAILSNPEKPLESRIAAAMSLGELRHPNALSVLVDALSSDPKVRVRAATAYALGRLARVQAYEALALSVQQDDSEVVRGAAAYALGNLPGDQTGGLEQAIKDVDARVRLEAAWSIGRRRLTGLVATLIARLQDPDCRVGAAAAWALTRMGDVQVCEALSAAVYSPCRLTSQAAIWALSELETMCGIGS